MTTDPYSKGLTELLADGPWAQTLARALVGDHDGNEITQEVLRKALTKPPTGDGSMRAYWSQALRWEASNLRRSRARRQQREQAAARSEDSVPGPAQVLERLEQRQLLAKYLLELPEDLRYALVLRYESDLNASEIGKRLGVSASTIRDRLARGREQLRVRLQRQDLEWRRALLPLAFPKLPVPSIPIPLTLLTIAMNSKALILLLLLLVPVVLWGIWQASATQPAEALSSAAEPSALQKVSAPLAVSKTKVRASEGSSAAPSSSEASAEPDVQVQASTPEAPLDFHVLARLLDETGQPLPEAQLKLSQPPFGPEVLLKPDALGRIEARVTSDFFVEGSSTQWEMQWEAFEGDRRYKWGSASSETGNTIQLGDLHLPLIARYRVHVVDREGLPLVGCHLTYRLADPFNPFRGNTYYGGGPTDSNGDYTSRVFSQGRIHLRARHQDWICDEVSAVLEPGTCVELPTLVCAPRAARMPARVRFQTQGGELIRPSQVASRSGNHLYKYSSPKLDSEMELLFAREHAVMEVLALSREKGLWGHAMFPVREAYPWKAVELVPMVPIRLRAADESGKPMAITSVQVFDRRWKHLRFEYQAGHLQRLPDGSHELLVPDRAFVLHVEVDRLPGPAPLEFDGPPSSLIQIRVADPYPMLHGEVHFEGEPVAGASVSLHRGERPGIAFEMGDLPGRFDGEPEGEAVQTSQDGRFDLAWSLKAPAVLVVQAPGFPDRVVDLVDRPGEGLLQVDLETAGWIDGRVRYDDGSSVAGMNLALMRGAIDARTTRVAADGTFSFSDVAPGTWYFDPSRIEVTLVGMSNAWNHTGTPWDPVGLESCWVEAGEQTSVDLVLKRSQVHALSGRIRLDGVPMGGWKVDVYSSTIHGPLEVTTTDSGGRFDLALQGPGPFQWNAGPSGGGVVIQRDLDFRSGSQESHWELDLHSAVLEVEVGTYLNNVSFTVDLGDGFEAIGFLNSSPFSETYRQTIPAGAVRLRVSSSLGAPPLADPGPYDLSPGETWRIRLP